METKKLRKFVSAKIESIPNREISPGLYVKKVGYEYVHIVNTWGHTRICKIPLQDFYNYYFEGMTDLINITFDK